MDCQLSDYGFGYPWRYIRQGIFNGEPGRRNGVTTWFHTNVDSVYIIMMVSCMFDGIVENARYQCAFNIVIGIHRLECWYGMPLNHIWVISFSFWRHFEQCRCISVVLRFMALPFIQALRNVTFPQNNNVRPHVACTVRLFLGTKNVRLLSWPARSLALSQIESICSVIAD